MSDSSVAAALRSGARRVVVEAPAGTGKTYQAATYAAEAASGLEVGQRLLILTHTHAARGVFAARTHGLRGSLQIATIDSLVTQVARIYHRSLELPAESSAWSSELGSDLFGELARRVRALLNRSEAVRGALVRRFPVLICDEHQDASRDQHGIVMTLGEAGSRLLVFGDPMQSIYGSAPERRERRSQWSELIDTADEFAQLDKPHRWARGSAALGEWVLAARAVLASGSAIDLRGPLPDGLTVIHATNRSPRRGLYALRRDERSQVDAVLRARSQMMILAAHTDTVRGLNAFWGRRIPIWEGSTREGLTGLLAACARDRGDALGIGRAFVDFVKGVSVGFTEGDFGAPLLREIESGCTRPRRGRSAHIQELARRILDSPTHLGVGAALDCLQHLIAAESSFGSVKIDLKREYREAQRLRNFGDLDEAINQLAHLRSQWSDHLPTRAISTVHKSKGLECSHAMLVPCDRQHFPDNDKSRCLLYVALSRASNSLTLIVPPAAPSPLVVF